MYDTHLWGTTQGITVLSANHTFIPQMEWAILPLLSSRSASPHVCRYSFPVSHRIGGWVGYIRRWYARLNTVTYPKTDQPTVRRPGIELTTIESHVRRFNHKTTEPWVDGFITPTNGHPSSFDVEYFVDMRTTPSLFHSRLKTYLFHKSCPP